MSRITAAVFLALAAAAAAPARPSAQASAATIARAIVDMDAAAVKRMLAEGPVDFSATVSAAGEQLELVRLAVDVAAGRVAGTNVRADDGRAIEVARAVFAAGADPNHSWRVSSSGTNSMVTYYLVEHAVGESPALLDVLIEAGLDMKAPGPGEALVTAAERGWTDTVRRLVEKGADVNHAQRKTSYLPLSQAVHYRETAIIEILERAGAREW